MNTANDVSPKLGPELTEAEAMAAAVLVHNHIERLKVWERKLRTPYMPTTRNHFSVVPQYPKPTLLTLTHMCTDNTFASDIAKLMIRAAEGRK